ncbi:MAG: Apolipoprotein N-acyltransferase, partial [Frankiales bacterium]|nr:Apolipoprotein N-acyltransferase [Frankiales bacterium]
MPWTRIVLALGSGGLLNLAFPPHDAWWLAPIAVALLTAVVRHQERRTGGWLGLVHGLGFFVPLLVWTGSTAGPAAWLAL